MSFRMPFLITIPHGGNIIPPEVSKRLLLTHDDLIEDADAYTDEIFNVEDSVSKVVSFRVFRAVVDSSRSCDELPPGYPDGCIKSHTCFGKQVYKSGMEPSNDLIKFLINNYYKPFHSNITSLLQDDTIDMLLDCHSMASVGPPIALDSGEQRPLICIGNNNNKSCSLKTTEFLADAFRSVMNLDYNQVTINSPFKGGYITQTYGKNPKPVLQIEINRSLYLFGENQEFTLPTYCPDLISRINGSFRNVLRKFYSSWTCKK